MHAHTHNSFSHLGISLPYVKFYSTPRPITRGILSQTEEGLARDMEETSL